ncbi:hypothetical protein NMG60_11014504 [Bertholletia excelsa]
MATLRPVFRNFISLLLLIYLGCFFFKSNGRERYHHHPSKKRKASLLSISSPSLKPKTTKSLSSSLSFLKRVLTRKPCTPTQHNVDPAPPSSLPLILPAVPDHPRRNQAGSRPEPAVLSTSQFLPLRNNIFPCPGCGEIFQNPDVLEEHEAVKHAVSEPIDGDPCNNIVRIIFGAGWPGDAKAPNIHRVMKINNRPKTLARFEQYRESVKARAGRNGPARRRDERCIFDGNELMRFHCATLLCDLGQNGNFSVCSDQCCSACGIISSGFSLKMDGISTLPTSWRAHAAIPEDMEKEFEFMNVKRAMLVCRVIAGRVGCETDFVDKEDPGFDSVVGAGQGAHMRLDGEDELLVFNPRAVLPCFVIVYSV